MKRFLRVFAILLFLFLPAAAVQAQSVASQVPLSAEDRVLILAPHPDDEAIGTAGIIQRAVAQNLPVRIVYFTNGDNNELSFIVYEKRVVFLKRAFVSMGELRKKEAVAAMGSLGLNDGQLVFLGYPDFGTMEIFTRYWNTKRPFRSMLTRVTKVPYRDSPSYGAPYVGESILTDLKNVLLDFKPTKIFVSHSLDVNRDHRALNLFLRVALWDLEGRIPGSEVLPYLIHVKRWPLPRGFHPDLELKPPANLKSSQIAWQTFRLTPEEVKNKKKAISFYRSQTSIAASYLFSFARKNELFGDYPFVVLPQRDEKRILWQDVNLVEDEDASLESQKEISKLAYARHGKELLVRLTLRRRLSKKFGINIYLFGYSRGKSFGLMPKLNISFGWRGLWVKDKKRKVSPLGIQAAFEGRTLVIKVPYLLLGCPEFLLANVRTSSKDLPFDNTAWRVLQLQEESVWAGVCSLVSLR